MLFTNYIFNNIFFLLIDWYYVIRIRMREYNFEFDEYEYSLNDGIYKVAGIYKPEGFESVVTGCFAEDNGYAVILNNGDIGYLKDGKYTHLVNDDFVRGMDIYLIAINELEMDVEEPITKDTKNERNNTNLIVGNGCLVLQCTLS